MMIKQIGILIFLTSVSVFGQDYNVLLKIDGIKYDTALVAFESVQNDDDVVEDIAIISNGELKYKFDKKGFYQGYIIPYELIHKFENGEKYPLPSSRIIFYINDGDIIKINATVKSKIVTYKTSGNNLSKQLAESKEYLSQSELFKDRLEFEFLYQKKKMSQWTKDEENAYWVRRNQNNNLYSQKLEEFILNHPDYESSPRLILEIKDQQKAAILFNQLTPEAKNSYFGKVLSKKINGWAITTSGTLFPNFTAKTLSGKDFNLNDYKGKYVLLDFWGSWCGPCIKEIPEMKKLKSDFKDKLVIVGLVCNDSREKMNNAIKKI